MDKDYKEFVRFWELFANSPEYKNRNKVVYLPLGDLKIKITYDRTDGIFYIEDIYFQIMSTGDFQMFTTNSYTCTSLDELRSRIHYYRKLYKQMLQLQNQVKIERDFV